MTGIPKPKAILLVGGYSNIRIALQRKFDRLKPPIYIADHWNAERNASTAYRDIPRGVDAVVLLSSFCSHKLSNMISKSVVAWQGGPYISTSHKWSVLRRRLEEAKVITQEQPEGEPMSIQMPVSIGGLAARTNAEVASQNTLPAYQQASNFKQKLTDEQVKQRRLDVIEWLKQGFIAHKIYLMAKKKYGVAFSPASILKIAEQEGIAVTDGRALQNAKRDFAVRMLRESPKATHAEVTAALVKSFGKGIERTTFYEYVKLAAADGPLPTAVAEGIVKSIIIKPAPAKSPEADLKSALELLKEAMTANGVTELIAYFDADTGKLKTSMKRMTDAKMEI